MVAYQTISLIFLMARFAWGSTMRQRKLSLSDNGHSIQSQYIVLLRKTVENIEQKSGRIVRNVNARVRERKLASSRHNVVGITATHFGLDDSPLQGLVLSNLPEELLHTVIEDEDVLLVEKDQLLSSSGSSSKLKTVPWGLDRIDQATLPLDGNYKRSNYTGLGVDLFVLDSGIALDHSEIERQSACGFNALPHGEYHSCADETGHGTHVAAIIGGSTIGIAPEATLISVKVINGTGWGPMSSTLAGIAYAVQQKRKFDRPSILNLSLGKIQSEVFMQAVDVAISVGITVVVAAGNEGHLACSSSSGRSKAAIVVGAATAKDEVASFSNFGSCVDIFAPGEDIISAARTGGFGIGSGTSFATPFVAAVAALYLERNPTATPDEVWSNVRKDSVGNKMSLGFLHTLFNTPNRLVSTLGLFS